MSERPTWRVHTSSLLQEILNNEGTAVLTQPLRIFANLLAEVSTRASQLNDPELNVLMLRLTLYDAADPTKRTAKAIDAVFAQQRERCAAVTRAERKAKS